MIVVTGATGQLGQSVIENLLKRVPADQIVASVRDPDKAGYLADKGVKVRRGDFSDPASLKIAFARADQALIVSADKLGEEALRLHRSAIDAAVDVGVRAFSIPAIWARGSARHSCRRTSMREPRPISKAAAWRSRPCATASMPKAACTLLVMV